MDEERDSFRRMSDEQLLNEAATLAERERTATATLIACLAELDTRRSYVALGYTSLHDYCIRALLLSEKEAYCRIAAARAARTFPAAFEMLADGSLTLTNLMLLAPHLTADNQATLFHAVARKTKRQAVREIAALLPETAQTVPWHFEVPLTTDDKLHRARELLRHVVPNGDAVVILDRALTLLLADVDKKTLASVSRPQQPRKAGLRSRRIPAFIRRKVYARDRGRCTFVGTHGRCQATAMLEFHHIVPFAGGGEASVDNIQLRCRTHNQYEMERDFPLDREPQALPAKKVKGRSRGRGS